MTIDRATLRALAERQRGAVGETRLALTAGDVLRLLDALDAAEREADRWRHGVPAEGDYVCPTSLALDQARADLAAEREAHMRTERARFAEAAHVGRLRDAAIARAEVAERARDAFRAQAEASLVVPCACGRPMPSVSSRLRCDACRAEAERDEARATLRAAANRARGIAQAAADDEAALAVLGPLVAERDQARADFIRYAEHESACSAWGPAPCDCGCAEALARAEGR